MLCGWEDCTQPATTALTFYGLNGHVHNCRDHERFNREWSAVHLSAPMKADGSCPFPCTEAPIHTSIPSPL